MKVPFLFLFLFISHLVWSQYEPLQSSGEIPKDLTTPSHIKYKKELENVDRDAKRRTKQNQKQFFLESNFGIDDLLQSGLVMFNDPVSQYIQEVANVLLEDDPALLKKLRFYTIRTPSVNAFATNQGIIFVNMGLIAQLENEAQLAFILAHEIAHYQEKHALEFYLETKSIERQNNRGYFRRNNFDATLAKNQFSKEQESEADALGLQLFLKSNYNLTAVNGAFDVLQYAYLPFEDIPFDMSYFEDEYLFFKNNCRLDSIKAINTETIDDDSESTHPSISKRRIAAEKIMETTSNEGRTKYIVSEERFQKLKQLARYESLEYHLRNYEFYQAIYNAYLLQQKNPDDIYLKKIIGKSLYGLTKFSNAGHWRKLKIKHTKVEGEFGSLVYFFNKAEKLAINTLALRYIFQNRNTFAGDEVYEDMLQDVCQEWVNHYFDKFDKFQVGKPPPVEAATSAPPVDQNEDSEKESSKYDKIRNQKKEAALQKANSRAIYYGLGDMLEQRDFQTLLEESKKNKKTDLPEEEEIQSKKTKYYSHGKFALGEKKILVINPLYLKLKKGYEEPLLIQTEKAHIEFLKTLEQTSQVLQLEIEVLDFNGFSNQQVEALNDLSDIQNWFGHHLEMDEDEMIAFNQEKINAIADKYNVDAILWTGVITGKSKKHGAEVYAKLLITQFEAIYDLFSPKGESIIFSIVLDTKTGKARMGTFDLVHLIDNKDMVKQHVYDILRQIKKKRK